MTHIFLRLFLAVVYFASQGYCLEWILDDAVHLTAEIETRSPDESEHSIRLPGKCLRLRQCYPILFLTDRTDRDEPTSINSDLIDFILETSESCTPSVYYAVSTNFTNPGDAFIWCRGNLYKESAQQVSVGNKPYTQNVETKNGNEDSACGQVKATRDEIQDEERVVGGSDIKKGEAPYLVAMIFKGKQVCGASIIDEHHVLTAAHCVSHLKPSVLSHLRFLVGDHDIKSLTESDHQERNVSKIIYHKEFSSDTLHDDIAMVKLSEPIQYSGTVSPICLHDGANAIEDGTNNGKLVGWGQVEEGGERSPIPRAASLRIWKTDECEEVYDGVVPDDIFEKAFCAGGFQDGGTTDACRGDSGGPLTILRNKRQVQVGVVSFGIGCGRYPGVFTKVSEYQSWIDRHRMLTVANE